MKTQNLFLLGLLMAAFTITSCSKDEETEPEKVTKTVYLVKTVTTVNEAWGIFVDNYTYDASMRMIKNVSTWGTTVVSYDYAYDASDRISSITKDGVIYKDYEYLTNVILEKEYTNGTLTSTRQYNVDENGKATREQEINSSDYTTYEWTSGNMTKEMINSGVSPTINYYYFNTSIKNPMSERYMGGILAKTNVNVPTKTKDGEAIISTANAAGYVVSSAVPSLFGAFTATYTYETKIVEVE